MLKSMRSGAKSIPMRIFLLALVAGFAMWGIDDVFRNVGASDTAVRVGDVEISAVEAVTEFERTRRAYLPAANNAEAVAQGMLGDVLAGLTRRALFTAEAERLGLAVTRDMEKAHLANESAFLDDVGRFSILRFQDSLSSAGLSEELYLNYINQDLKRNQIITPIADGLGYSHALARKIAAVRLERRVISYVEIDARSAAIKTPSNAEIDAWYGENGVNYNNADLRAVTALVLSPDVLMDKTVVSDEALRDAYNASDDYTTIESRDLRQMVFSSLDAANDAAARIKAGTDFSALAKTMLNLNEDDITLSGLTADDLPDGLSKAVFNADIDSLVGPIGSPLGQHLLIIDGISPSSSISFDDAKDELATALQRELATDMVYNNVAILEDSLGSGSTLTEAANAAAARIITIDGMDRNGRDIDGNMLDGIAADTKFRQSVWTADIGVDSLVEETNADTFYVLRVEGETVSAPRPLNHVRNRVIADMKVERGIAKARAIAEKLMAENNLTEAAATQGLKIIKSPAMRRDGVSFDHAAARLIANKAFTLDLNEVDFVETGDQAVVITVDTITPAVGDALDAESSRIAAVLSTSITASLTGVIANGLTAVHDVDINANPVQSLLIGNQN